MILPPCVDTTSWPCNVAVMTFAAITEAAGGGPCLLEPGGGVMA